jgi:glycosyltransferase involved in cell wall biosynthesis
MSPSAPQSRRPVVVLSANSCWNLVNFRGRLIRELAEHGYRVVALAPLDTAADELTELGVEVRPVPISRSGTSPLGDAALLASYFRQLRAIRPAAYCGFTIKPNVYGGIAARLAGVPAIANVTGIGTSFLSQGLVWRVAELLYRLSLSGAEITFFHNPDDLELMAGKGLVRRSRARVIPGSGVDLDHFRPAEDDASAEEGPRTLLFIGRLILHKGVRELVEAARMLKTSVPEARVQLLGSLDPGNPTSIAAAELDGWIEEGVVEHFSDQADVRPFISAATAIVLPSYREGLSRALLEAAAMAKPLIGTDVPGVRELVIEGETGARCAPRDSRSLAGAMERIATAPAARLRQFGRNARDKVEREFSDRVVARAYLDVLDPLVKG